MSNQSSQKVVDFIAGLSPLYIREMNGEEWCARCLQDGTVIRAVTESEGGVEDCDVEILWQGEASRATTTRGAVVASIAIARWAELRSIVEHPKHIASREAQDLLRHFTVKTGEEGVFDIQGGNISLVQLLWAKLVS